VIKQTPINKLRKKNLLVIAGFVLAVIAVFSFASFIKYPILDALKYPLKLVTLCKREILGFVFYHRNYLQNELLKKEVGYLKCKLNNQDEIVLENQRLRESLSLKKSSTFKVIAASCIGRPSDNQSSGIIIDKGKANGIKTGMTAITFLGLVGRVTEVSSGTSKVALINDPNFAVSAITSRSRQEGLVCGTLGNSLVMKYLPADADISSGDTVITSGTSQFCPKGLLIGSVKEIVQEFSGLVSYAYIKPVVELSSIEDVLIIAQ